MSSYQHLQLMLILKLSLYQTYRFISSH